MYAISQRSALIIKKVLVFPRLYARQCHQRSFRHAKLPTPLLFIRRLVQTRRTWCQLPSLVEPFFFFFLFLFLGFPFFFFFCCRGEKKTDRLVRKQMEKLQVRSISTSTILGRSVFLMQALRFHDHISFFEPFVLSN